MICKYIDDLPTHWEVEDMDELGQTLQPTTTDAPQHEKDKPHQASTEPALPSTSSQQRGVKRTLSDENSSEFTHPASKMAFVETGNKTTSAKKPSTDAAKTVDAKPSESQAKSVSPKPSSPTSNPEASANANKNYFDNKSIVIDYLLKKNDDMTHKKTVQLNETSFKKESTLSSKSHSKIVLFDENDNEDEEEAPKSPQNEVKQGSEQLDKSDGSTHSKSTFKEESLLNTNSHEMDTLESSVYDSAHSAQSGTLAKFTKENLAKFTKEQDELYTQDILRKVQRPIKVFSECPQNICAQAPNVFSRNEYEPPMKRARANNNKENPSSPTQKLKPVVSDEQTWVIILK